MKRKKRGLIHLFLRTFEEFGNDKVFKLSAALAYYTVFSLPSMLIIIISITGFIFGKQAAEGQVYTHLNSLVGSSIAQQIEAVIKNAHLAGNSVTGTVIGIVTLLVGATGIFSEMQDSLNIIWGIRTPNRKSWLAVLINRGLAFIMVLGMGFVLIFSLILNALLSSFGSRLSEYFPNLSVYFLLMANYALIFLIIVVLIAVIYKVLPDAKISYRDVFIGALITALLFMIGKFGIGVYLEHSHFSNAYGAASSIILLLLWVYYSSVSLYLGAEFTQVFAHQYGGKIRPKEYAVLVKKEEIV